MTGVVTRMSRLSQLRYLRDRRRLIERAINRRRAMHYRPWLEVLSEADYKLVRTFLALDKEARITLVESNERLAHIIALCDGVNSPADLERLLYPDIVEARLAEAADRQRQKQEKLELDRREWEARYLGLDKVLALAGQNWLLGHGFPLPTIPASKQEPLPPMGEKPIDNVDIVHIINDAPIEAPPVNVPKPPKKALSLGGEIEDKPQGAPRCVKCRQLLQPSRSDPSRLVCNFCGFPVGDHTALNQLAQSGERPWWDR